jgi:hypothetical protein
MQRTWSKTSPCSATVRDKDERADFEFSILRRWWRTVRPRIPNQSKVRTSQCGRYGRAADHPLGHSLQMHRVLDISSQCPQVHPRGGRSKWRSRRGLQRRRLMVAIRESGALEKLIKFSSVLQVDAAPNGATYRYRARIGPRQGHCGSAWRSSLWGKSDLGGSRTSGAG